jgi:anti-sigma factor ChrR (cupin superfamily)
MPGVTRMMLDRIGDEVARATSFVRYAPNSTFPAHEHGGGEEILVLEGEFADEHGRYPAGSYLRNPVGSSHAPRVGIAGAEIFVKLHQFDGEDRRHVALDTFDGAWLPGRPAGVAVMPLHRFGDERVTLLRWPGGLNLAPRDLHGGAELLLLEGRLVTNHGELVAGSWLRLPPGARLEARAGVEEVRLYLKLGHLVALAGAGHRVEA